MKSLWFVISFKVSLAAWTLSPQPLPIADEEQAVGAWDGKILVLGGFKEQKQLTEIDTNTQTVVDLGTTLPAETNGQGQYWTQVEHIIYMINRWNPQFNIYNMIDRTYTINWMGVTIPTNPTNYGCLASDSQYLYVTGGSDSTAVLNALQVLTISTKTWLINPPTMNQNRVQHACIVHNGYLWVFGGSDFDADFSVNERISTTDILNNKWDDTINPLTITLCCLRCIGYYGTIYVIGGLSVWSSNNRHDIVHLVDANTGSVTVSPDRTPQGTAFHSPIIWENVLYVIGGFSPGNPDDDWAYYPLLPSSNPTALPSRYPTVSSSNEPTKPPSFHPSTSPTDDPSNVSTVMPVSRTSYPLLPSSNPSESPSFIPTALPSSYPTVSSSNEPTNPPSIHPSTHTDDPSNVGTPLHPSLNPSLYPTLRITFASEAHYTISITMNECLMDADESDCAIDEHQINNIIIAFLDENVQILETQIIENEINILIAIVDEDYSLDKDIVADGIQREMEVQYGDVDVTIKETEDQQQETAKPKLFSNLMIITLGAVIVVICVVIVSAYLLYNCFAYRKHVQQLDEDGSNAEESSEDEGIITVLDTKGGVDTKGVKKEPVSLEIDNAINNKKDEGYIDVDEIVKEMKRTKGALSPMNDMMFKESVDNSVAVQQVMIDDIVDDMEHGETDAGNEIIDATMRQYMVTHQ